MKVAIDHIFEGLSCVEYEALYFDEPFNVAVGDTLEMGRELLHFERTSQRIVRHVCYEPKRDPKSDAGKAFGTTRASFVEQLEFDLRTHRGEWRTIPNLFPDRVRNSGTIEFSDVASGVKRSLRGEVKVSAFGFGRIVERMIVTEIERSYTATAKLTIEWIARGR